MKRADLFRNAIARLEADEDSGREEGLSDPEFDALRSTLQCTTLEWFRGSMEPHPRIVALGFALAIHTRNAQSGSQ